VAHGKQIPFLPILELFRNFFGITPEDGEQAAREKIAGRMLLLDEALRDGLPLVFDFLGVADPERPLPPMDAETQRRQVFAVIQRVTQARSRRAPAITLIERALGEARRLFTEMDATGHLERLDREWGRA
jgi:hypothetical protein